MCELLNFCVYSWNFCQNDLTWLKNTNFSRPSLLWKNWRVHKATARSSYNQIILTVPVQIGQETLGVKDWPLLARTRTTENSLILEKFWFEPCDGYSFGQNPRIYCTVDWIPSYRRLVKVKWFVVRVFPTVWYVPYIPNKVRLPYNTILYRTVPVPFHTLPVPYRTVPVRYWRIVIIFDHCSLEPFPTKTRGRRILQRTVRSKWTQGLSGRSSSEQ